jgi:hypothetical protein
MHEFKFFSHWLCAKKQNILLQHMHDKKFIILTNKCGNKLKGPMAKGAMAP